MFLDKYNLLDKPSCIYNCDESGFPLSSRSGKVMAPNGLKSVHRTTSGSKQQTTTLACYNAAGNVVPPFHVFPGERFKDNPLSGAVPNSYMGRSDNGLMTTDLFYLYCDISFLFRDMEQSIFIAKKYIHEMYKTIHNNVNKVTFIVANCPETSGTVPELFALSRPVTEV